MAVDAKTGIKFERPVPMNRVTEVETGKLRGVPGGNPAITVFKGIPYAKAPVGELRWKKPQKAESWKGIRNADKFGGVAMQDTFPDTLMYGKEFYQSIDNFSEDCLYLNIWTPSKNFENDKLPVMFWIHGGGLSGGNGHEPEFDGEEFGKNGVILVTINYRLNIFGFFAHPELSAEVNEDGISGNYGHYDQLAALQWVYRNIKAFGGDPENITIFGQSAGAGSVQTLITSDLTENMIKKAIIQSGVSIPRADMAPIRAKSVAEAEKQGIEIMEAAGCKNIGELRDLSYDELMAIPGMGFGGKYHLGTVIDGLLVKEPAEDAIAANRYKEIPYLVGNTAGEAVLFARSLEEAERERQIHAMELGNRIFAYHQDLRRHQPVYLYRFDRDLPGTDPMDPNPVVLKSSFHSSELWYVFKTVDRCWRPMSGIDYDLSTVMNKYWSNFAKTGDPNGEDLPKWEAFTVENQAYMHLGDVQELRADGIPALRQQMIDETIARILDK